MKVKCPILQSNPCNYDVNVEKVITKKHQVKTVSIVIATKQNVDINTFYEINKTRKVVIMAEYVKLVNDWVREHNIKAKIVHVHGSSESYLVNDLCDACVVVNDTGKTLADNNLVVLDTLIKTSMHLFIARDSMAKAANFI